MSDQYSSQAYNRYGYVSNNPTGAIDPSGYRICEDVTAYGVCVNPTASIPKHSENDSTEVLLSATVAIDFDFLYGNEWFGGHAGLGTAISSHSILTHNHFFDRKVQGADDLHDFYVSGRDRTTSMIVDGEVFGLPFFNPNNPQAGKPHTQILTTKGAGFRAPAMIASQEVIRAIHAGDMVEVVYWNNKTGFPAVGSLSVTAIDDRGLTLADPDRLVWEGSSGGGIFYDNLLIANILSYSTIDHAVFGALVPSRLHNAQSK